MKKLRNITIIVLIVGFIIQHVASYMLNKSSKLNAIPICSIVIYLSLLIVTLFIIYFVIKNEKIKIKSFFKGKKDIKIIIILVALSMFTIISLVYIGLSVIDIIIGPQEIELKNVSLEKRSGIISSNTSLYSIVANQTNGKQKTIDINDAVLKKDNNRKYIEDNENIKVKYYKYNNYIYEIEK